MLDLEDTVWQRWQLSPVALAMFIIVGAGLGFKVYALTEEVPKLEIRIERLEAEKESTNIRLGKIDSKLEGIDQTLRSYYKLLERELNHRRSDNQ